MDTSTLTQGRLALTLAEIQGLDFDSVFRLTRAGVVTTRIDGVWAPSVYHDDALDVTIDSPEWSAMRGLTGQYSYSGAVMHSSEVLAPGVVLAMLETVAASDAPSLLFALVVVNVMPEDGDDDPEPAGWAIMYRPDVA